MKKNVLNLILIVFAFISTIIGHSQNIREVDRNGDVVFFVTGQNIKQSKNSISSLYYYDITTSTVKIGDKNGKNLYYIDGNTIRRTDKFGQALLFVDYPYIRNKDRFGASLYYIDGNTIRRTDKFGEKVYYFTGVFKNWIVACLVL